MAKDYLIDTYGNFVIENGDFVVGDSELQEVAEIIESHPGEWKEDPVIGCALTTMLKSNFDPIRIEQKIKNHLTRDGKDYENFKNNITFT